MAKYKVWLTVKDTYGNTKEISGGTIDVDLDTFTESEISQIKDALPLENYVKKAELPIELDEYATDKEVEYAVQNADTLRYADFILDEDTSVGGTNI